MSGKLFGLHSPEEEQIVAAMTREQALECARFLRELRRTANVSLAAEQAGVHRNTLDKRRRRHPDFASDWDAALAFAQVRLAEGGAIRPTGEGVRTEGGEYSVRASRGRQIQVRRAKPGLLTPAGERTFLAHLAATANIRLSAQATGIGWSAIYARRRISPEFEQAMDAALAEGYDRVELALLESATHGLAPDGGDRDAWRDDAAELPNPLTRMTFEDARLLLAMHFRNVKRTDAFDKRRVYRATREETNAALKKAIAAAQKRMARAAARGE
ncbi:hypothetical protein [Sphingomonas sp. M1-B02]|uniref:hypothetical protein n=1 Tax=Sphingomonas sp. M1-B02 TaxID=3114300 RepID=UPI00224037A6|nr:hypothetical protein [Sphingomonas sp. S6-11]UZK67427.1 hypothetical protein OKW87_06235 [Sphingomonas sp. S6-11]